MSRWLLVSTWYCRARTMSGRFYCPEDEFEPVACDAKTYRNETGDSVPEDCKTCTIEYYCNNLSMIDQERFPCKPGYYCRGGNEELRKCPAGHYRSETGRKCGDEANCLALIELDDTQSQ